MTPHGVKEEAMRADTWTLVDGEGPIVATAIHDGHDLRDEVAALTALSDDERRREEDPYTGAWTAVAPTRLVVTRSRFEADLNRPRDRAVYVIPADAWGLSLWKRRPPAAMVERSLEQYDAFYVALRRILASRVERHGGAIVLDLHTYNHRRDGPDGPEAGANENPQVNLGTGSLDRIRWAPVIDRFLADLRAQHVGGRPLDVRENVKFRGGHMSRWIHATFPGTVGSLAIEFKKFFMDEWTGTLDDGAHAEITRALRATVPGLEAGLRQVCPNPS